MSYSTAMYFLGAGILAWVLVFLAINWFYKYKLKYDILRSGSETETTGFLADTVLINSTVKLFNGYGRESRLASVTKNSRKLRKLPGFRQFFEAVQGFFDNFLEIGIFISDLKLWQKGVLNCRRFLFDPVLFNQYFQ